MFGLCILGAFLTVNAGGFEETNNFIPGIIHFPVNRLKLDQLDRRSTDTEGTVTETLSNRQECYTIQCSLGTPAQEVQLQLDTGSSDFWVIDSNVTSCGEDSCDPNSRFNPSSSSSYHSNNTLFYQQYEDYQTVNGTLVQDVLTMGGATIDNFNFAVANITTVKQGVAGIGLPENETPLSVGIIDSPYPNLPVQLKSAGLIAHVAYSLYLNSYSDAAGSILFGGIDEGAFLGDLYRFPLASFDGMANQLAIKMQSLWVMNDQGEQQKFADTSYPVIFDSGSTVSSLPEELLKPLMESMGVAYDYDDYENVDLGHVKCSDFENNHGGFGFTLGDVEFFVNFRDLLIEYKEGICVVGFDAEDHPIFGDNILRSLYVVYDFENKEIAIAKANTNSSIQHSYKTIESTIPGKLAPGYNDSVVEYSFQTHPITVFGVHQVSSLSNDGPGPLVSGNSATTTAPVEATVGGKASTIGLVPTYSGVSSGSSGVSSGSSGISSGSSGSSNNESGSSSRSPSSSGSSDGNSSYSGSSTRTSSGSINNESHAMNSASSSGVNSLSAILLGLFSFFLVLL